MLWMKIFSFHVHFFVKSREKTALSFIGWSPDIPTAPTLFVYVCVFLLFKRMHLNFSSWRIIHVFTWGLNDTKCLNGEVVMMRHRLFQTPWNTDYTDIPGVDSYRWLVWSAQKVFLLLLFNQLLRTLLKLAICTCVCKSAQFLELNLQNSTLPCVLISFLWSATMQ